MEVANLRKLRKIGKCIHIFEVTILAAILLFVLLETSPRSNKEFVDLTEKEINLLKTFATDVSPCYTAAFVVSPSWSRHS